METTILNANEYRNVSLSLLSESRTNPRRIFEDAALKELAESIRTQGVLSPLLVKLPSDQQEQALSACFREDWSGSSDRKSKRILLPVRNLQFWIEQNVLLLLKDAPFDRRDAHLVAIAGSCVDCPKRTGHNKLLFSDLGKQDACKLCGIWATASLSCWLPVAARPE